MLARAAFVLVTLTLTLGACGVSSPTPPTRASDEPLARATPQPAAPVSATDPTPVGSPSAVAAPATESRGPDLTAIEVRCDGPGVPRRFEDLSYFPQQTPTRATVRRVRDRVEHRLTWTPYGAGVSRAVQSAWSSLPPMEDADDPDLPRALASTPLALVAELGDAAEPDGHRVFVLATTAGVYALPPPSGVDGELFAAWPLQDDAVAVLHRESARPSPAAPCWVSLLRADGGGAYAWTHRVDACGDARLASISGDPALYDGTRLWRIPEHGDVALLEAPPQPDTASLALCPDHTGSPVIAAPSWRRLNVVGLDAADLSQPSVSLHGRVAAPTTSAVLALRGDGWCLRSFLLGRDLLFSTGGDAFTGVNVEGGGRLQCRVVSHSDVE